ncbi:DNA primase [Bacillus phage vB_BanS-Thrax1]|nr:DNA primase [Bacillus phage vB_BanS-Thrax1]
MSDDLKDIKTRIYEEDKVYEILEAMGCEYIRTEGSMRVTAQLPEHFYSSNKRSVQVKLVEHLSSSIRNRKFSGDIFRLVSYIHHNKRTEDELRMDTGEAKKFICETLGWHEYLKHTKGYIPKTDYLAPLRELMKGKKRRREVKPNPILDESILDDFYYYGKPLPYKGWIEEGISYNTQIMYGVGFDLDTGRITMPMRNRFGQLIGVKGRIMKDEDDERKYMYIYRYQNSLEWFNFHYAHPYILTDKKVYIFEAEKSSMKSFDFGLFNTLAIGASDISDEQVRIIKKLGLDIEIILCYDKGIEIEEIVKNMDLFTGREVKAVYDKDGLLRDKNSPVDQGIDTWNQLVNEYTFTKEALLRLKNRVEKNKKKD